MIVNLLKPKQLFSIALPQKVKGQYWISDTDDKGQKRNLVSIEAIGEEWVLKSNKMAAVLSAEKKALPSCKLTESCFIDLQITGSDEKVMLFTEPQDLIRQSLAKVVVNEPVVLSVGRLPDNHVIFNNEFVSSHHAQLIFDGAGWSVRDLGSRNGTYVNGMRVSEQPLHPGDYIYIMGLKIVIGDRFLALNNPDEKVKVKSGALSAYEAPALTEHRPESELPDQEFFLRSPSFRKEIRHREFVIDAPPQPEKADTVPLPLMLGPAITMGMTSVSTGMISMFNVMNGGGTMIQAMPSLVMSGGMLCGTILWPVLTKRHEKKTKIKKEQTRHDKYLAYLSSVSDQIHKEVREQSEILCENLASNADCIRRIMNQSPNLWERVIGQKDFLQLRLGIGSQRLDAEIKYPDKRFTMEDDTLQNAMLALASRPIELEKVPVSLSLTDQRIVGVYGDNKSVENLLKSLILQIVALHSYDEVKVVLMIDEADIPEWDFVKYIPHFWSDDKKTRFFVTNANEMKEVSSYLDQNLLSRTDDARHPYHEYRPYYVIAAVSGTLRRKCNSINLLLKCQNNTGFSILFKGSSFSDFPKETQTIIEANSVNSKQYEKGTDAGAPIHFEAEDLNETALRQASGVIANIEIDTNDSRYSLPAMLTFLEMFGVGKVEHLNSLTRWKENNPTKTLQTPVGVDTDGDIFYLDLHEKFHGPHGLVAGMTGSGKSEFIITFILSLAVNYHPDEVAFILIDYKGGGLTGAFEDQERGIKLPHLAGTITNLDGSAIKRSLVSIQSELRHRQAVFNQARKVSGEGTMDIYKYQQLYRDKVVSEPLPHLFLISDEFAELKAQQPEFMDQLISTARIGRSLGLHLILATQKPSGVVDDQIWSNSKFRVCLKVQDKSDSQDMIKCPDAAELTQTGRFYLQVGYNELFALGQSAWCGADYVASDKVKKERGNGVTVIDNIGRTVAEIKPLKAQAAGSSSKQVVAIVKYLSGLADEEKISVRPLWLPPIPEFICLEDVEEKYQIQTVKFRLNPVVGEYDDPFNQRQDVLTIPLTEKGNCVIYGATGTGKTTFLTALCCSLIRHHSVEELNLYIMDFGSETLKAFEKAPQVGGVITAADEDMTVNLIKMLMHETDRRKNLFSESGGDYAGYCQNSGETVPGIVVVLNNFSGFAEQYPDLMDAFTLLTRDGSKYGICFVISATNTNAVRYKIQQNFKMALTMQLNDPTDYAMIVGKTNGLVPSGYKGRGLVAFDRAYEFQTAYCTKEQDIGAFLRNYCEELAAKTDLRAVPVPVLPEWIDLDYVKDKISSLKNVPVGMAKANLNLVTVNFTKSVVLPVAARNLVECTDFISEFCRVLNVICPVRVLDAEQLLSAENDDFESAVVELFSEMVTRNNTYKEANLNVSVLERFDARIYVLIGIRKLYERLSDDGKDKLKTLLEKAEILYKLNFVICDSVVNFNSFSYDAWYKRHVGAGDGIWIGEGVADQYLMKINKISSSLYDELAPSFGYMISSGKPVLTKLLGTEGDDRQ